MRTAVMDTTPVALAGAIDIEGAEAQAWRDMFEAAPAEFAEVAGAGFREVAGALVIQWAATGRRYFSRAIGLGVAEPVTEDALDDILAGYGAAGIDMFLLQSLPHCRPAEYEGWLRARGLEPFDAQDRIVRDDRPAAPGPPLDYEVERVTEATADEWAQFIPRVYGLDAERWLRKLVDRPRWQHYVARDGGEIVAARSMYICPDGTAWLGIDGPVPGVHWDQYGPDAALCTFIVEDGLARGARSFIADIEAPSDEMDTPAYEVFGRLGFSRPYVRTHWTRL
jgi:hypothetical protein